MKKSLMLFMLFWPLILSGQLDNAPVTGVSDKRPDIYGFRNATLVVDYQTVIEGADMLVAEGRIVRIGKGVGFPEGTIVYDLSGKTVYPSFIDIYAGNYGIKTESQTQSGGMMSQYALMPQYARQAALSQRPAPRIAEYWNDGINSSYSVSSEFIPDSRRSGEFRQAGFGAVVTFKADGLARGTSALVTTGDGKANNLILKNNASANYSFSRGRSSDFYPSSQFGIIALLRQLNYDAQWYSQLPPGYFHDDGMEAYNENLSLPQIFEVADKLEIMRADKLGKEFNIRYIIKGSGDEYQALEDIKKTGCTLIIPVKYPAAPDVRDPFDSESISYRTLKHYKMAPANLAYVSKEGIPFAITSSGLERLSDFLAGLRKAVKNGLPESEALKALTATPAALIGASDLIGALREKMVANFLITSGNIFSDNCIIHENWVQGQPYRFSDLRTADLRGTYSIIADTSRFIMQLSGAPDKPSVKISFDSTEIRRPVFSQERDLVSLSFETRGITYRLSGSINGRNLEGRGRTNDGRWVTWKAMFTSPPKESGSLPSPKTDGSVEGKIIRPFAAYGRMELPEQETILFRNATVWTNEKEGKLPGTDVLVKAGKISAVGRNLNPQGARVIDATGMHLTPGIIDEHSHIAMEGTNESGQAISSEVRVEDVIDPEDPSIYRQLAGGVTAAHILHGSANPIGGQSVLIKHRWGRSAEELKIENQAGFLKHALGENVKRSAGRYPNTRMGVDQIIRDAYQRAEDYNRKWKEWNSLKPQEKAGKVPPRRDLELDAIVDVLEKRSYIECHTYVQSEGTMIMELAKDFGLRVNSLIHFNEGYKVADQIRENNAGASVFSDWWDYKYEVYEGITYNAAVLLGQGVLTCLHSDDDEMGRRLNQEAAKTVKYGGVDEIEAKLVTLNPAKLLHLEHRMGSIKPGKDADLVLWTDHPLSVYSRASKTMVDGIIYYDEESDAVMKEEIELEKDRIISDILKESSQNESNRTPNISRR